MPEMAHDLLVALLVLEIRNLRRHLGTMTKAVTSLLGRVVDLQERVVELEKTSRPTTEPEPPTDAPR